MPVPEECLYIVLTEVALSKTCIICFSFLFEVTYVPHPHLPSWSDMTESSIDRKENKTEPEYDKTNILISVPSEDSDQPGHPPSLIRVFAVCLKKPSVLGYPLSAQ